MPSLSIIAGAALLALLVISGAVYFVVISPLAEKKALEKPMLASGGNVTEEHVAWLANEIGAYKIHALPTGEPALFSVSVDGADFSVTASGGVPVVTQGRADSPDLRITASRAAFTEIMNSQNLSQAIAGLYRSGAISIAVEKDEVTLALKGYKAIYDEIMK